MNAPAVTAPLSASERRAVQGVCGALVAFALFGFVTHAPSTVGYLASVVIVAVIIGRLRREPLPPGLAFALVAAAILHLAGGLVRVGDDVLYNGSIGPWIGALHTHVLQYDHFAHAFASGVATLTIWQLLVPPMPCAGDRRAWLPLCALAGLGVGAINETVEFLTTIAHRSAHVGGYTNTGWDLVANTIGVVVATAIVVRRCDRLANATAG